MDVDESIGHALHSDNSSTMESFSALKSRKKVYLKSKTGENSATDSSSKYLSTLIRNTTSIFFNKNKADSNRIAASKSSSSLASDSVLSTQQSNFDSGSDYIISDQEPIVGISLCNDAIVPSTDKNISKGLSNVVLQKTIESRIKPPELYNNKMTKNSEVLSKVMATEKKDSADYGSRENRNTPKIQVIMRKRPLKMSEVNKGDFDVIEIPSDHTVYMLEPREKVDLTPYIMRHEFQFDRVLSEFTTNHELYNSSIKPIIEIAITTNLSTSIFAYGQTGSGKSYTMLGTQPYGESDTPGILELAADDFFRIINERNAKLRNEQAHDNDPYIRNACRKSNNRIKIEHEEEDLIGEKFCFISFFEIYNGKLFDLLQQRKQVNAYENSKKEVVVRDLHEEYVANKMELMSTLIEGVRHRKIGANSLNDESSRSHAVLTMQFKQRIKRNKLVPCSKIVFIDLAGSERGADVIQHGKDTQRDGAGINKSLLALKECIRAMDSDKNHIPFRDSELTKVLRDIFISDSYSVMIANISPSSSCCEQTLNTLRYASKIKNFRCESTVATTNKIIARSASKDASRPSTGCPRTVRSSNSRPGTSGSLIHSSRIANSMYDVSKNPNYKGNTTARTAVMKRNLSLRHEGAEPKSDLKAALATSRVGLTGSRNSSYVHRKNIINASSYNMIAIPVIPNKVEGSNVNSKKSKNDIPLKKSATSSSITKPPDEKLRMLGEKKKEIAVKRAEERGDSASNVRERLEMRRKSAVENEKWTSKKNISQRATLDTTFMCKYMHDKCKMDSTELSYEAFNILRTLVPKCICENCKNIMGKSEMKLDLCEMKVIDHCNDLGSFEKILTIPVWYRLKVLLLDLLLKNSVFPTGVFMHEEEMEIDRICKNLEMSFDFKLQEQDCSNLTPDQLQEKKQSFLNSVDLNVPHPIRNKFFAEFYTLNDLEFQSLSLSDLVTLTKSASIRKKAKMESLASEMRNYAENLLELANSMDTGKNCEVRARDDLHQSFSYLLKQREALMEINNLKILELYFSAVIQTL